MRVAAKLAVARREFVVSEAIEWDVGGVRYRGTLTGMIDAAIESR